MKVQGMLRYVGVFTAAFGLGTLLLNHHHKCMKRYKALPRDSALGAATRMAVRKQLGLAEEYGVPHDDAEEDEHVLKEFEERRGRL